MIQYIQEVVAATFRTLFSLTDIQCWFRMPRQDKKLFINRDIGNGSGGPTRFLRQLVEVTKQNYNLEIENRYPCRAKTALIMAYAWRPWFYHQCQKSNTRTVLRLDGFYVSDATIANHGRSLNRLESYRNKQMQIGLKKADFIIYQSLFSKNQADQKLSRRNINYSIIPNGVDVDHFKPASNKNSDGILKLLVLGKHYNYHISWAAKIFYHLRREVKAKLIFVGPPRDKQTSIENIFRNSLGDSDLFNDVIFQGNVNYEDLPQIITKGDILLHVKVGDSCPNAVIEAMACGLPVVCPEFGGTKELVENAGFSVTGPEWTMSHEMHISMAEAVYAIYRELGAYSNYARERSTKYFDRRLAVSRYLEVLDL